MRLFSLKFFWPLVLACLAMLTACGGVPVSSLPRLYNLSQDLMQANLAEFRVALQVDARLVPQVGAVPMLVVKLQPREPGTFEAVDTRLPLQLSVASIATSGLAAPGSGRRWLVYSMPAATQAELQHIKSVIERANSALPQNQRGGSLSIGVAQDSLAVTEPALANTHWETWLQIRQRDGFFEVWSGTPAQLQKVAAQAR